MLFDVYDTTLRDGTQQEGINVSVADKLAIAELIDELGVGYIEGGWPGAVPKDTEFFRRAQTELHLKNAVLAAFGMTRSPGVGVDVDLQVRALLDSQAPMVTLVAKSDSRHVERALKTTRAENLAMITDTVALLRKEGRRVVVDAEHFFDGYRFDPEYGIEAVRAAFAAGAETVTLCDTNGGMLPDWTRDIVAEVINAVGPIDAGQRYGMHAHNDTGCAVANSLAAVDAGALHVQGTVNGYGERTGNADLIAVVANLEIKRGMKLLAGDGLRESTRIAHAVSEIVNMPPFQRQPYVGASSFAHKAGLHASAIRVDADLYQHIDPTIVGNDMRMLVSEMAGRSSIELKGREFGIDLTGQSELLGNVTAAVKAAEAKGYTYDASDASFELLLRDAMGTKPTYFEVESWRTIVETVPGGSGTGPDGGIGHDGTDSSGDATAEATVKLVAGGERVVQTGEGNGPVNALDAALRGALSRCYPEIAKFELVDYKVRLLDSDTGTDSVTRVLVTSTDGNRLWTTVGVGANIIEASWEALTDALVYGLLKAEVPVAD
jgi:2-isopropylmalate synthase